MADTSRPAIPPGDAAANLLHSELNDVPASAADLDCGAKTVSLDLAMASSPSVPVYNSGSSVSDSLSCPTAVGVAATSGSPTALATSCSSTPPTPQSHGSESSPPTLHSDAAVTVPPPPYSAHGPSSDLSGVLAAPAADPLAPTDPARSQHPPPPKKPLTPYMRFSKSIWQKVKAANQNFTVCEIGATIGRLWREMTDVDKQQYNDDFAVDKARYDGELQLYLKATGLQASDLVKAKVKKSKSSSSSKSASYTGGSSPSHSDAAKPVVESYPDTVNGADGVSGVYTNAANGLAAGGTLPHFSQVWSSTAQDVVFNADQLLAQMAGNGQAGLYHGNGAAAADTGALLPTDDSQQHLQPAVYHEMGHVSSSTASSQDQAAMTSWLWQQYAAAAATAGVSTTDQFVTAEPSAVDGMTNGSVIVYQLNADGTPTAAYTTAGDLLEPGEVRLPVSAGQTNGVAEQGYSAGEAAWLRRGGTAGSTATVDSEKQLLRGALVDKVREIQRLTRELEQAYALIHQLKQHNEFMHRQWGAQLHVPTDASTQ